MMRRPNGYCALGLILMAVFACPAIAADKRQTPSGFDVPRYITLKFGNVNARAGPGDDHKLMFVYRAKGLPLQVIAETTEWRRVCDPEGQVAWIHKRLTDGRRTVINTGKAPAPIYRSPKADAEPTAYLNMRAMAELDRCDKGWCRVKVPGAKGWVPVGSLWGTSDKLQCR